MTGAMSTLSISRLWTWAVKLDRLISKDDRTDRDIVEVRNSEAEVNNMLRYERSSRHLKVSRNTVKFLWE